MIHILSYTPGVQVVRNTGRAIKLAELCPPRGKLVDLFFFRETTTMFDSVFAVLTVYNALQGAFLCLLTYFAYNLLFHPLAKVPGPFSARVGLPWFRTFSTITRSYSWRLQRLHEEYGPLVRLGPNFVSTIEPEIVNELYAHGSSYHKTEFYLSFGE